MFFQSHWANLEEIELHSFGDASPKGYGAVVYIRKPNLDGTYQISFVIAKTKVAPLKKVTLPRLELLGSLLAARLHVFCRKSLHLPQSINYKCWTDSTMALSWVKGSPGRWKQFVANRVTEIQDLTDPANWDHCPGDSNPADPLSRGISPGSLVSSAL